MSARASVLTWDRRIDVESLAALVDQLGNHVHLYDVGDTGSDDYALVVATVPLEPADVGAVFDRWWTADGNPEADRPDVLDLNVPGEPWRFDAPEVPATAIKDRDGDVWLLVRSSRWADAVEVERGQPYPDYEFVDLLAFAPLVECEDPRAAS